MNIFASTSHDYNARFQFHPFQKLVKIKLKMNEIQEGASAKIDRKKKDWISPMTKLPPPTEKSKQQNDNKKGKQKSITQRLQTDLGR